KLMTYFPSHQAHPFTTLKACLGLVTTPQYDGSISFKSSYSSTIAREGCILQGYLMQQHLILNEFLFLHLRRSLSVLVDVRQIDGRECRGRPTYQAMQGLRNL